MKNKALERIFQEKLGDLRMEPSEQTKDLVYHRIKKRGRIILYKRLSIAASVVIISFLGVFYFLPGYQDEKIVQDNSISSPETMESPSVRESLSMDGSEKFQVPEEEDTKLRDSDPEKRDRAYRESTLDNQATSENQKVEKKPEKDRSQEPALSVPVARRQPISGMDSLPGQPVDPDISGLSEEIPIQQPLADQGGQRPFKITIEYIASGSKTKSLPESKRMAKEFYSRMNGLVYPEEVLGDIRSFKDQILAFDFINAKKVETQNKKEK
jgi:hypothetical protein